MATMFQGSVEENVLSITWNNQSDALSFKVNFELINRIIEAEQRKPEIKLTKMMMMMKLFISSQDKKYISYVTIFE